MTTRPFDFQFSLSLLTATGVNDSTVRRKMEADLLATSCGEQKRARLRATRCGQRMGNFFEGTANN